MGRKRLYGYFKWRIGKISHEETLTWLQKSNLKKKKTDSLLIAEQNNATKGNYIKSKIDNTQQNILSRIYGDKDEMVNLIITECCKLAQKEYKSIHDWVGKGIHWELCKKLKFHHTTKLLWPWKGSQRE